MFLKQPSGPVVSTGMWQVAAAPLRPCVKSQLSWTACPPRSGHGPGARCRGELFIALKAQQIYSGACTRIWPSTPHRPRNFIIISPCPPRTSGNNAVKAMSACRMTKVSACVQTAKPRTRACESGVYRWWVGKEGGRHGSALRVSESLPRVFSADPRSKRREPGVVTKKPARWRAAGTTSSGIPSRANPPWRRVLLSLAIIFGGRNKSECDPAVPLSSPNACHLSISLSRSLRIRDVPPLSLCDDHQPSLCARARSDRPSQQASGARTGVFKKKKKKLVRRRRVRTQSQIGCCWGFSTDSRIL